MSTQKREGTAMILTERARFKMLCYGLLGSKKTPAKKYGQPLELHKGKELMSRRTFRGSMISLIFTH